MIWPKLVHCHGRIPGQRGRGAAARLGGLSNHCDKEARGRAVQNPQDSGEASVAVKPGQVLAGTSLSCRSFVSDTSELFCISSGKIKIRTNEVWQWNCTNSLQTMLTNPDSAPPGTSSPGETQPSSQQRKAASHRRWRQVSRAGASGMPRGDTQEACMCGTTPRCGADSFLPPTSDPTRVPAA